MIRKESGDGGWGWGWAKACFRVSALKTSARWEQLRVQVKTGLWKRSDTGFGLGGWSEVRTHRGLVKTVGRRREQGLDVRGRSEGGNNWGLFGEIRAGK